MTYSKIESSLRFKKCYSAFPQLGVSLDVSRVNGSDDFFARMGPQMDRPFDHRMIAHPDEGRTGGHYWLRSPALVSTPGIQNEI